jgi:hypothetical protein
MKRILLICLLLLAQVTLADVGKPEVEQYFLEYVDALKAGDVLAANNHWSLLDRSWADQLNIKYQNAPVKLEVGSALYRTLDQLKAGTAKVAIDSITMSRGFAKISYRIVAKDSTYSEIHYALTNATVQPSLVSPLRVYTESWDQMQARYFDLMFKDYRLFERSNLDDADAFIDDVARTLGLSETKLELLQERKFRVVLCESFGEVQQLTNMPVYGDVYKPVDAVISKFLPPFHEIAQFLVDYAIDSLPLCTLPFIEEGTATFLGGRWGRSAPVMLYLGSYIYGSGNCEWKDLLTNDGFRGWEDNPDFTYPVAGIFCKFLFEKIGRDKYFQLYRQLSGTEAQVRAMTEKSVQDAVAAATGKTWILLLAEFKDYAAKQPSAGVYPGATDQGTLVFESGTTEFKIKVLEDSTMYNVIVTPVAGDVKAALLIGQGIGTNSYESFLYKEYFPESDWKRQRHALIFSNSEVGTYDFYANAITGKLSVGFGTGEPIQRAGSKEYRFHIEKKLLGTFEGQQIKIYPMK